MNFFNKKIKLIINILKRIKYYFRHFSHKIAKFYKKIEKNLVKYK